MLEFLSCRVYPLRDGWRLGCPFDMWSISPSLWRGRRRRHSPDDRVGVPATARWPGRACGGKCRGPRQAPALWCRDIYSLLSGLPGGPERRKRISSGGHVGAERVCIPAPVPPAAFPAAIFGDLTAGFSVCDMDQCGGQCGSACSVGMVLGGRGIRHQTELGRVRSVRLFVGPLASLSQFAGHGPVQCVGFARAFRVVGIPVARDADGRRCAAGASRGQTPYCGGSGCVLAGIRVWHATDEDGVGICFLRLGLVCDYDVLCG